jgi:hypothetical protein
VHTCFFPHDAEVILRICLVGRGEEDFIAWNYERSGLFSVRSAYKLALELDQADTLQEGSSSIPDGSRSLYKGIWSDKGATQSSHICLKSDATGFVYTG